MPAVVVTTPAFLPLVQVEASLRGIGEPRALVVEHPIGGVDGAGVEARAEAGAEALRRLLGLS